jgi:RNA polymerase sigma factor (sigma-70 family)
MRADDTTLGGDDRRFPTTQWTRVQDPARLDELLRAYWKPAYVYIRIAWRKSNEDAKDLAQAFFARLVQNGRIAGVQADGGRFRSYLKRALKNFLIDADRAAESRRPVEAAVAIPADAVAEPDRAFDREWLSCLLTGALAALEAELKKEGKTSYFDVFRLYLLEAPGSDADTIASRSGELRLPTYGGVARALGIGESDVRNFLSYCRARLRTLMKEGVRGTVEDTRDVEDELRALLNA